MNLAGTSQDRMRAVLVIVATFATIAFNGLAAAGYVNGVTPEVISDKYPTVLTPAGYAFSIWSLIYLGLIIFSVYQLLSANLTRFRSIRSLYIVSCVLNCAWIFFWHREQIAVCLVIILMLLAVLLMIRYKLQGELPFKEIWLVLAPFGIYAGWVTAATLVNFDILLASMGVTMSGSAANVLGVALIIGAAAAAVLARIKLYDFFYPLAVAWAITAIAVKQSGNTAIVVAAAVGVIICIVTTGSVVTELKDSTSE